LTESAAFAFPALEGEPVRGGDAAAHAAAALEEAAARAREEGFAAGLADADAQLAPARAALVEAARELVRHGEELAAEAERRAAELALVLAEKILHASLEADPSRVAAVVTGALRRVVHRDGLVLEVNPADVELVRDALGRIEDELGTLPRLEVAGERRVARGGCVVRTPEGEIDARVEAQLAKAAAIVAGPAA
jgi:flagellar assembly protein FliH